jgi:hypothetical protein
MTKQYTKRERQMFVHQLKKARPLIDSGRYEFVCYALEHANGCSKTTLIRTMISDRLQFTGTINSWLRYYHPEVYSDIFRKREFRSYRLAWIDNMIEEFSK